MSIHLILIMIIGHWLSDFIFQTTGDIFKKGNKNILTIHSIEYSALMSFIVWVCVAIGIIDTLKWYYIIGFFITTFITHYIVDYFTSKLSNIYWNESRRFEYFSTIITDQILHLLIIFLTIQYFFYV